MDTAVVDSHGYLASFQCYVSISSHSVQCIYVARHFGCISIIVKMGFCWICTAQHLKRCCYKFSIFSVWLFDWILTPATWHKEEEKLRTGFMDSCVCCGINRFEMNKFHLVNVKRMQQEMDDRRQIQVWTVPSAKLLFGIRGLWK